MQDVEQSKDIRVQLGEDRVSLVELEDLAVSVGSGKSVRLKELADIVVAGRSSRNRTPRAGTNRPSVRRST